MLCRHLFHPKPTRLKCLEQVLKRRLPQPTRTLHQSLLRHASSTEQVSRALQQLSQHSPTAPVRLPSDQHALLTPSHPATNILAHPALVIHRQLEMLNVFAGFEQANRYIILDAQGHHIGYMAEQEHGLGNAVARQTFRTHRSFTAHVFDRHNTEVLRLHRPFAWLESRIRVYDAVAGLQNGVQQDQQLHTSPLDIADMRVIGESQQQWAPLRRKYNLFLHRPESGSDTTRRQLAAGDVPLSTTTALVPGEAAPAEGLFAQFAYVDEPWRAWDFALRDADGRPLASVNRTFSGFAREVFTDTGVYALRMDGTGHMEQGAADTTGLTLDQRAVMLATAVSIDFDYFSWHSSATGGFWPMFIPWGGVGGAAEEAGAAGGAEAAGGARGAVTAGGEPGGELGTAGRESAAVGAGTMAGYEMMQRGVYGDQHATPSDAQSSQPSQDSPAPGTGEPAEPGWFDLDLLDDEQGKGHWDESSEQQRRDQAGVWSPAEGVDPRDFDRGRGGSGHGGNGEGGDAGGDGGLSDAFPDDFF